MITTYLCQPTAYPEPLWFRVEGLRLHTKHLTRSTDVTNGFESTGKHFLHSVQATLHISPLARTGNGLVVVEPGRILSFFNIVPARSVDSTGTIVPHKNLKGPRTQIMRF